MGSLGKYDVHCHVGDFKDAVQNQMDLYIKEVQKSVPNVVELSAKRCVQFIRVYASTAGFHDKKYGKSWKAEMITKNAWGAFYKVWSPKHYRIAHLLEYGRHTSVGSNGKPIGVTRAYEHLKPAEEDSIQFLEDLLKKTIQEI